MTGRIRARADHIGELTFNMIITHLPLHRLRLGALRLLGARIGPRAAIFRGTTVIAPRGITVGSGTHIGFRCMLDGRAGLTIGENVVIASDTHLLAGHHDVHSAGFEPVLRKIHVGDHVWLATRVTVQDGVTIGRGAVVMSCALVARDVEPMAIVAGVPARRTGTRRGELTYTPAWRPIGY